MTRQQVQQLLGATVGHAGDHEVWEATQAELAGVRPLQVVYLGEALPDLEPATPTVRQVVGVGQKARVPEVQQPWRNFLKTECKRLRVCSVVVIIISAESPDGVNFLGGHQIYR